MKLLFLILSLISTNVFADYRLAFDNAEATLYDETIENLYKVRKDLKYNVLFKYGVKLKADPKNNRNDCTI